MVKEKLLLLQSKINDLWIKFHIGWIWRNMILLSALTPEKCQEIIEKTKSLKQWIEKML